MCVYMCVCVCACVCWTSPRGNAPQNSSCTATNLPSRKPYTNQTCGTLLEK